MDPGRVQCITTPPSGTIQVLQEATCDWTTLWTFRLRQDILDFAAVGRIHFKGFI